MILFIGILIGITGGGILTIYISNTQKKDMEAITFNYYKFVKFYYLLSNWLKNKNKSNNLGEELIKRGYRSVAIYGMKEIGELLLEELRQNGVDVKYAIDKNADNIYAPIDIYTIEESKGEVDAIIVTAISNYEEIRDELVNITRSEVISIEELIPTFFI